MQRKANMASRMSGGSAFGLGLIGSAGAVVVTERVGAALEAWSVVGLVFVALALVQFVAIAGFVTKRVGGRPTWLVGGGFAAGIPIGVLADVLLDSVLFANDRNLFPFEIIAFWIIGLGPALWASMSDRALDRLLGLGIGAPGRR